MISVTWISLESAHAIEHEKALLSPEELKRADAYRHTPSQEMFIRCRAQLRRSLSQQLATEFGLQAPPTSLHFENTARGKPVLMGFASHQTLHFNVSHSGSMGIVVIAKKPIGVDIERLIPREQDLSLAKRFFHPEETQWIETVTGDTRSYRFLRLWTLKEAILKATGEGIAEKLAVINLAPYHTLFEENQGETTGKWHIPYVTASPLDSAHLTTLNCHDLEVPPGFIGALAIESP